MSLPFARPEEMQAFVDSVSDPKSPSYRRFLTPEAIGERFGLPQSRVDAIADYLRGFGFAITEVANHRLVVTASGTIAQAESAFHTGLAGGS